MNFVLWPHTTAAGAGGTFVQVDAVTAPGITNPAGYATATVPLAGRTSYVYTVWYHVAPGDTVVNTGFLRAQTAADTPLRDDWFAEVRRVLTLTKSVAPGGTQVVGTDLTYTLQNANVGEFAARSVTVTDSVPPQVALKVGSVSRALPTGLSATVAYLNASGTAITASTAGCAAPAGYDSWVRRIVRAVSGDLPAGATLSEGQFGFIARIR